MKTNNDWVRNLLIQINHKCKSADGFSTKEFAAATGLAEVSARAKLREAFAEGLIECAGRRRVISMDGYNRGIPVYKLKKQ
jgi:hypothetical protein